jgi:hypothetical protein
MVTNGLADKTAPEISILEPSLQRGLKPASGMGEITVKGKANDQGEIKEVMINGEKVYVNAEGVFWGNVRLIAGINRISVEAVDGSGNASRLTFEVEHAPGNVSANENYKPGRNYALLIGCQNYDDSRIQSLQNPISDAIKLKIILRDQYNFSAENIFSIFNPGLRDFKKQIIELSEIVQPEDNLLIFYAGHGVWLPNEKKGFWMLADAVANDVNTWLPNKEVIDWLSRLQSRHTLLITDACFSGSVFRTRGFDPNAPSQVQQLMNKVSRTAITSGNDTEVPDESVFMKYLIKALAENREKYLSAQKMFVNQIIEPVMNESKIEPRYGTLEMAGHIGGDFIFVRK